MKNSSFAEIMAFFKNGLRIQPATQPALGQDQNDAFVAHKSNHFNVCVDCLKNQEEYNIYLFDTGVCCSCGKTNEVIDIELISLYLGIGFNSEFIYSYLPRLRKCPQYQLTMNDIGYEIRKFIRRDPVPETLATEAY